MPEGDSKNSEWHDDLKIKSKSDFNVSVMK
jgi:hypothetical protein